MYNLKKSNDPPNLNQEKKIGRQTMTTSILLESGTNELEVVEFYIKDIRYGVNVTKVEEVRYMPDYRSMPQTSKMILGFFNLRGKVIPIIDLPKILGVPKIEVDSPQIIVMHFNERVIGFLVERVAKIIRLSWSNIIPPPCAYENHPVIGVIIEPGREKDLIQLIDFEKIMEEIAPVFKNVTVPAPKTEETKSFDRGRYKVWLAEDSKMIQKLVSSGLAETGYTQQEWFSNGAEAWDAFNHLTEETLHHMISILVADIEMPQMDGLTLTRRIKDHPLYKKVPVVVFSSLINQSTMHKCQEVGADTQVAKPDIESLVICLDELIQKYEADRNSS